MRKTGSGNARASRRQTCYAPDVAEFIGWVLLGLFAGAIARRVMPGEEKGGCLVTIGLGILGAVVGGWIGKNVGFLPPAEPGVWLPSLKSVLTATVGAIVVLAIWKWLRK
jgi:uncharacterized membrane protein YeaQ/YmgE (transglycosylase-associated protein family)